MTLYWSDREGTDEWWPAPPLEEETPYWNSPTPNPAGLRAIASPGAGEVTGLKKDLVRKAHNKLGTRSGDRIMFCYRPTGASATWGDQERTKKDLTATAKVDVFATRFEPGYDKETARYRTGPWWHVGTADLPVFQPVRPVDASIFGSVAEAPVRALCSQWLKNAWGRQVTNLTKRSDAHGSDITWLELAEMYGELARTTNDEFLGELANELATLG